MASNKISAITDIRIYPIKSCRGISLPSTILTPSGLTFDRRWMFVDAKHKFLTIRQKSQMTLINTAIDPDSEQLVITIGSDKDKQVKVPLHPNQEWLDENAKQIIVDIWEYETEAYAYTDPFLLSIFKEFFGQKVHLVMKDPHYPRICGGNGSKKELGREATVNFPDVLPILIASESSLSELNERLTKQGQREITYERFRPNIIIKGGEPWTEDSWKKVRINGSDKWASTFSGGYLCNPDAIDIDVVARCARCQVPNVDPATAEKDKHQPWDTLMKYRRIDEGIKFKPCFGMLSCPRSEGKVEVGMKFEVLQTTSEHRYVKGF